MRTWGSWIVAVALAGLGFAFSWLAWKSIPCQTDPMLNYPGCFDRYTALENTSAQLLWAGSILLILVTTLRHRFWVQPRTPNPAS
ncbi:MAG: hypothetical protein KGJ23_11220 [Euryarchaeota archaeon]|nr:hypothetical protein [Euryarchaeota archaeon]MDE1837164.1 hypothetical protein [Euryarchaeota archaeon]MDE1881498.1 hypothetical protein [Euryarchaeota archaeon]MDE2045320.1 hypothetical protein [Thermoplasmata archaeon]